jgi:hypothetical protein
MLAHGELCGQMQREHRFLRRPADLERLDRERLAHVLRARRRHLGQRCRFRGVRREDFAEDGGDDCGGGR